MQPEPLITDITNVIRLAVAPVFLLTAIGTFISVLTQRLGRVVDRSRWLEQHLSGDADHDAPLHRELCLLSRRMGWTQAAIVLAALSALSVCLLIACAFIGAFVSVDLSKTLGVLFILAMLALIACLLVFLREIFLSVRYSRETMR